MKSLVAWWDKAKIAAINHWVWMAAIAAITLLIVSPLIEDEESRRVAQTIGSVILASGIAGAVIRSSTFTEMFIGRIVDVFYDGDHLRSRNDLRAICTRTLNALLEKESTMLRGAVGSELLDTYLDFKLGYIYKDFTAQIQVERVDKTNGTIHILETTRATIVPSRGTTKLELKWTWISASSVSQAALMSMSIDGTAVPLKSLTPMQISGGVGSIYTHQIENAPSGEDSRAIEFVRRVRKVIDVKRDPVTVYRYTAPCLGMSVELLDFPDSDLKCQIQSFGLPRDFSPDRNDADSAGHWRSQKYAGLIFPRQGVMLHWLINEEGMP
jgi:hypothetical protein